MKFIITEEQSEKLNQKVKSMVNKFGIEYTLDFFDGDSDIIRRAYQDNPSEYLNQFNNLTPIEKGNKIYYVDEDGLALFYYYPDRINGYAYSNYDRVWVFFENIMRLERSEIKYIINNWLEKTYNIKGLIPGPSVNSRFLGRDI
jgi:hypothetical protein